MEAHNINPAPVDTSQLPQESYWWIPTTATLLETAETAILNCACFVCCDSIIYSFIPPCVAETLAVSLFLIAAHVSTLSTPYISRDVYITPDVFIHTIILGSGPPLVLFHGYGGGTGAWAANLDSFAQNYTVYSIDLPGFGRSSRQPFKGNSREEAEDFFLLPIRLWADSLSLTKFTLLGHSFGSHLATLFALRWPTLVSDLILVDTWGGSPAPPIPKTLFFWFLQGFASLIKSPFSLVRAMGPVGHWFFTRTRPDLDRKFATYCGSSTFLNYAYHCNAHPGSGDIAFSFLANVVFPLKPLSERVSELELDSLYCIYGDKTWMAREKFLESLECCSKIGKKEFLVLPAGHHVYIDAVKDFNDSISHIAVHRTLAFVAERYPDLQEIRSDNTVFASRS